MWHLEIFQQRIERCAIRNQDLESRRQADLQTRTSNLVIFTLRLAGKMYRYTKFSMKERTYIMLFLIIHHVQRYVLDRFGRKKMPIKFWSMFIVTLWDKQLITAATPTYSQEWNPPTWYQVGCTPDFLNLSTSFGEVTCIDRISPHSSLGPWGVKNALCSMGSTESSFPSPPSALGPWIRGSPQTAIFTRIHIPATCWLRKAPTGDHILRDGAGTGSTGSDQKDGDLRSLSHENEGQY